MDIQALVAKVEAGGYTPSTQEAAALYRHEHERTLGAIRQYEAIARAYPRMEPRYRACIGQTYQDPQGRKITVLAPHLLFPTGRTVQVVREDDQTWPADAESVCEVLGIA